MLQPSLLHPKALQAIRSFPKDARREIGEAILDLQKGSRLTMPLSRPMPSVGAGVQEIRVRDADGIFRVFYLVKSARGVIVFHAFQNERKTLRRSRSKLAAEDCGRCCHE